MWGEGCAEEDVEEDVEAQDVEEDGGGGAGELGVLEEGELPCEEAPRYAESIDR